MTRGSLTCKALGVISDVQKPVPPGQGVCTNSTMKGSNVTAFGPVLGANREAAGVALPHLHRKHKSARRQQDSNTLLQFGVLAWMYNIERPCQ